MAASVHRIEVRYSLDPRLKTRTDRIRSLGFAVEELHLVDVYTIATDARDFTRDELVQISEQLANPVVQEYLVDEPTRIPFDHAIEVGFLPGVTDNIGATARQTIEDFFSMKFGDGESVYSSQLYLVCGNLPEDELKRLASTLANPLVNRVHRKTRQEYGTKGMDVVVPAVRLHERLAAETVDLDVDDAELLRIGKQGICDPVTGQRRGPLALDLDQLHTIRDYFRSRGRKPTDVELEALAQTWSEHCKHTIFASAMDDDVPEGLYKSCIKAATNKIREERGADDICVSVFSDNSGAIVFDDTYIVTHKVETHNSPSALDPFGGALTGIVGVNRDTIGFGLGAKPCMNVYGFCVGDPDTDPKLYRGKGRQNPVLSPRRILDGVVHGVGVGGNCSGIPTPQGFVYCDARYSGKPLVFAGTVGIMPREHAGRKLYEKKAEPGDLIVVIGGRVGKDGIHGATFSSEALDPASPVTAVQIGDPITQKKFSDVIVKEARDAGLYRSITDNGAGGISCSVAEMAKECNGCHVRLDTVPLKYPGMAPWEIWISESQERMTLAVPKENLAPFMDLMQRRDVEATVIGEFTDTGRCVVEYHGATVMDIDLAFLHDGLPKKHLKTTFTKKTFPEPGQPCPDRLDSTLLAMLRRRNICSKEYISTRYDHAVQGGHVLGPLQGTGRVQSVATLTKVVPGSKKGVGLSQAMFPAYSEIDPYRMACAGIDAAIRGLVALGIPLSRIAILDNFCWCSSDEPERLGQLKLAARGCYDTATAFGTPFISGKDSMFNDFSGFDADDNPVKVSVPPTLLISSIGVHDDVAQAVSLDAKIDGDLVYVIGETAEELGGSEYFSHLGFTGNTVPALDAARMKERYGKLAGAIRHGLVASAFPVTLGGLGIALAKVAIAGRLGMDITIPDSMRPDYFLFSESLGRFVVTVAPDHKRAFEQALGSDAHLLGRVRGKSFRVTQEKTVLDLSVSELEAAYKAPFGRY
ncbi:MULTISPECIES: AIR synthase-related protein [unclassified Methanoregula]|uniref:AIR synthase-related protein n=1 Tax=unclassified Methanoregula TaxID=2649730 RepID=UPI0009C82A9B|nr:MULTISPECIES: AIR synthase-related protein [unclassified Methanoregula]OPX62996.1 MAG: phosphoribosylformylglycinamidine synthase II [Methanoregula sp. PtaB.Bin085]OPY31574.1 MAG: phosphoribosylformylglycinamidine synthase II [Methanoregula sp. PtaU1.Bin006]